MPNKRKTTQIKDETQLWMLAVKLETSWFNNLGHRKDTKWLEINSLVQNIDYAKKWSIKKSDLV